MAQCMTYIQNFYKPRQVLNSYLRKPHQACSGVIKVCVEFMWEQW